MKIALAVLAFVALTFAFHQSKAGLIILCAFVSGVMFASALWQHTVDRLHEAFQSLRQSFETVRGVADAAMAQSHQPPPPPIDDDDSPPTQPTMH